MKLATKLALAAAVGLCAMPSVAHAADPVPAVPSRVVSPITVVSTADIVEINVRGVIPDADTVSWRWGKLHLPLESGPGQIFAKSFDDATIKRIALVGGESPRLMVMLRHGSRTSKKLVEATEFELVDGGFRLTIPRKRVPEPVPVVADPIQPPVAAAAAPKLAPVVVQAEPAADVEPTAAEPTSPQEQVAVAGATVAGELAPQIDLSTDEASPLQSTGDPSGSKLWSSLGLTMLLLAGGGGVVLWARRRNVARPQAKNFIMLGNQVLGPKSRIVLMGLGQRRMLIAVSEGGTTVVDKWSEGEHPNVAPLEEPVPSVPSKTAFGDATLAALEFGLPRGDLGIRATKPRTAISLERPHVLPVLDEAELQDAESSAVSGLMDLRRRMEENDSTAEEDDKWSAALAARMRVGSA